ncbi:hypothetical protein [Streptomyces sp. NBC_00258]|uniref:hypothetical protein n=1 Tax=Streptomyces sp. NBC_00258 TaxID=2903642 RepID=UPI002E2A97AD|nr:hypothetical protein [Streptomyces sp. NBC_00258]
MDDYATCDRVLDRLLTWVGTDGSAEKMVRLILLQQKSLRLWDSGRNHRATNLEALQLINEIDVTAIPSFKVGPLAAGSSLNTLHHILAALKRAVWSLAPQFEIEASQAAGYENFPTRDEQLRTPRSEELLRIRADRSEVYANFVSQTYKNAFRSSSRYVIGGPMAPDLFPETFAMELLGHAEVRKARKELALMRLLQVESLDDPDHLRDALRLLRQAGAETELNLAVERLRAAGPLSALSEDARQILRARTTRELLRSPELRVLRGAAELMTPSEARGALDTVRAVLASGGPVNKPGFLQNNSKLLGEAWLAGAVLANAAEVPGEMVEVFLQEASKPETQEDDLRDRAIARAVRALSWPDISAAVVSRASSWLTEGETVAPATAEVVSSHCGPGEGGESETLSDLDEVAVRVNSAIRGNPMPRELVVRAVPLVRDALVGILRQAHGGAHSVGTLSAADIGAALIAYTDAPLWVDLADFLSDPSIGRHETRDAFERLAHERPSMPESISDKFRSAAEEMLSASVDVFGGSDVFIPYPEALRFLSSNRLLDEITTFANIAKLAGDGTPAAREQAARTVATIAEVSPDTWLLAVATQLSHDRDSSVKAHAGRALALLASKDDNLSRVANPRIVQLLNEDGVLIPFRLLHAMRKQENLQPDVRQEVERLSRDHPSRIVRHAAQTVIDSTVSS